MNEGIGLAIVARDETEALHRIEELHRSGRLFAGPLTLRSLGLLFDGNDIAHDLQVGSRNLPAAIDKIEGKFLSFRQTLEASALHLADVDEHVLTAFIPLDEAETLVRVEELHLALTGSDNLRRHAAPATAAGPARSATTAAAETVAATEAITTAAETVAATTAVAVTATEAIGITEAAPTAILRSTVHEGVETLPADVIPLVAPPAATASVKTHEP